MSLRCTVCKTNVDEGLNFCPACRSGFASQLECVSCGRLVPRGSASCFGCSRQSAAPPAEPLWLDTSCPTCGSRQFDTPSGVSCERGHGGALGAVVPRWQASHVSASLPQPLQVSGVVAVRSPQYAPPVSSWDPPHVALAAPVAGTFVVRQGGVEAEVRIPPGDAEVMGLMGQLVVILHTFAAKLNSLTGHSEHTRHIIRSARTLANDVQEELELRRGPGR